MAPIKGRLGDRKNATLELIDRELKVVTKGGFFGGKSSTTFVNLDEINSIEHITGVKPYPDALLLKIVYSDGELSFYSINKTPLEALAVEAENYVEKRSRLLVEMEKEFHRDREAHVALLYMNLELVDALMELVILVDGSINWTRVEEQYRQVERVNQDRDTLSVIRPSHLNISRLGQGVETRDVGVIKTEVYDLLFILRESCAEKARHGEPWFYTVLHRMFIDTLVSFWGKRLEALTDVFSGESRDTSEMRLQELTKLIHTEIGENECTLSTENSFGENHRILFEWIEALQKVEFTPCEELERRLTA